jgi:Na+/melibiose symporter-like transporter
MRPRLGFFTKFWFGFGQCAEGMKNAAFGTFLLLFYSQVLGLEAWLAGIALALSLCLDAVSDPIAGSLSDALRHRWGRRHPFMYASALPLCITFALAFHPPDDLGQAGLFGWMFGSTVLARASMALYHVPHLALGAELTADYHERTVVVAWRNFFGLAGAATLIFVCRQVFMVPTAAHPNGELNPAAYPSMSLFFGVVMMVAILLSAAGTHSRIPYLVRPTGTAEGFSAMRLFREMRAVLSNPSFRNLFLGTLTFFIARGVADALGIYMGTFFWALETRNVLLIPVAGLFGIAIGTPFWAVVGKRFDKKQVFVLGAWWFSILTFLLPTLKVVGVYPPRESPLYLGLIYGITLLAAFGAAAALVASGSMMADIADEHEYDTGTRQEGVFFGALSFSGKAAVGLGSGLAGLALTIIAFPLKVAPDQVPSETIRLLGIIAGPGIAVLMLIGILIMTRYHLTQDRLTEIQAALADRRGATRATSERAAV